MAETTEVLPSDRPRSLHFEWLLPVLIRPRKAFSEIAAQARGVWLVPILTLTLIAILVAVIRGVTLASDPAAQQVDLPPDFQYYSPSDQERFMQAAQATSSPSFRYIFPAIGGSLGVWVGWLVVSGVIHLATTLLGGRSDTRAASNLVAWAGLPFGVRGLVRILAMLIGGHVIASPGVSGFVPDGATGFMLFLGSLLALVDLYIVWHIVLLFIGIRAADPNLSAPKALGAVVVIILVTMLFQALVSFGVAQIGNLTLMRPFFF